MTYYMGLNVGAKRPVFHLSRRDGHVISFCQWMADFDGCLFILLSVAYVTKRVVSICASSKCDI